MSLIAEKSKLPAQKAASTNEKLNVERSPYQKKAPKNASQLSESKNKPYKVLISEKKRAQAEIYTNDGRLSGEQRGVVEDIMVSADGEGREKPDSDSNNEP